MRDDVLVFYDLFFSLRETVWFDILLSIFSSFLFIYILLFTMRPKIRISPNICYMAFAPDHTYFYLFKIVNTSIYYASDVEISLVKKVPYMVENGKRINYRLVEIETSKKFQKHIPKLKRNKNYGDHAYLIRTDYDIMTDIRDKNTTIQLSISAKHGLTNLTKIVSKDFITETQIFKDKEFRFGNSLEVSD